MTTTDYVSPTFTATPSITCGQTTADIRRVDHPITPRHYIVEIAGKVVATAHTLRAARRMARAAAEAVEGGWAITDPEPR